MLTILKVHPEHSYNLELLAEGFLNWGGLEQYQAPCQETQRPWQQQQLKELSEQWTHRQQRWLQCINLRKHTLSCKRIHTFGLIIMYRWVIDHSFLWAMDDAKFWSFTLMPSSQYTPHYHAKLKDFCCLVFVSLLCLLWIFPAGVGTSAANEQFWCNRA